MTVQKSKVEVADKNSTREKTEIFFRIQHKQSEIKPIFGPKSGKPARTGAKFSIFDARENFDRADARAANFRGA